MKMPCFSEMPYISHQRGHELGISKKSRKMKSTFLLVQNIVTQTETPPEVIEWVDDVRESLDAVFNEIAQGNAQ